MSVIPLDKGKNGMPETISQVADHRHNLQGYIGAPYTAYVESLITDSLKDMLDQWAILHRSKLQSIEMPDMVEYIVKERDGV